MLNKFLIFYFLFCFTENKMKKTKRKMKRRNRGNKIEKNSVFQLACDTLKYDRWKFIYTHMRKKNIRRNVSFHAYMFHQAVYYEHDTSARTVSFISNITFGLLVIAIATATLCVFRLLRESNLCAVNYNEL